VGIATQDPELRKNFTGKPEFVEHFFRFVAEEVREWMAQLGFRTMDEMVGRVDRLDLRPAVDHWKATGVDLNHLLREPDVPESASRRCVRGQDHGLEKALDNQLIADCSPALDGKQPVALNVSIRTSDRAVGTMLGYEITRRHGGGGLPEDTIRLRFTGTAGQSFGAFVPRGLTLTLEGDANDYFGKGLSGGRLIVVPPLASTFAPEDNVIIGNVALYGATSGEAFVCGVAGERFAVRNSGATAVVEGVGDHACEYMTAGRVVVLGRTGRNFAAGMSGGVAYVLDRDGDFVRRCNRTMVDVEPLLEQEEEAFVRNLISRHARETNSPSAARLLRDWSSTRAMFLTVVPRDYKRVLLAEAAARITPDEQVLVEVATAHG
jgi:glutamate synthase (ferredoxin)